jgi:hypothetical protein
MVSAECKFEGQEIYVYAHYLLVPWGSRSSWEQFKEQTPTTEQGASDAVHKHIKYCHTPEQETNSTNKTVKPNMCMATEQYQFQNTAATEVTLQDQLVHLKMAN